MIPEMLIVYWGVEDEVMIDIYIKVMTDEVIRFAWVCLFFNVLYLNIIKRAIATLKIDNVFYQQIDQISFNIKVFITQRECAKKNVENRI